MQNLLKTNDRLRAEFYLIYNRFRDHLDGIKLSFAIFALIATLISLSTFTFGEENFESKFRIPVIYILSLLGIIVIIQVAWMTCEVVFGKPRSRYQPSDRMEYYRAVPYNANRMGHLSKEVSEAFDDDTFKVSVLSHAVEIGSAKGLAVLNMEGEEIGFVDFYRLTPQGLKDWINGIVYESDMENSSFIPISKEPESPDKSIELIIGAIMIKEKSSDTAFYIGPLLATAAKIYLSSILRDYDCVTLYASMYKKPGDRFAGILGFKPFMSRKERGHAGDRHDVYSLKFHPADFATTLFAHSISKTFVLSLGDFQS